MQLHKLHIHAHSREGASSHDWSMIKGALLSLAAWKDARWGPRSSFPIYEGARNSFCPSTCAYLYALWKSITKLCQQSWEYLTCFFLFAIGHGAESWPGCVSHPHQRPATIAAPPGSAGMVPGLPLVCQKYTKYSIQDECKYPTEILKWGS